MRVQKYESTKTDSRRSRCEGLGVGQEGLESTQFTCCTSAIVQKLTRGAEAARGTGAREGLGVGQDAAPRLASEPSGIYIHKLRINLRDRVRDAPQVDVQHVYFMCPHTPVYVLQINLRDPLRDASVIMESLDLNGSQYVDLSEWCAVFEPAISKLESANTEYFRDVSVSSSSSSAALSLTDVLAKQRSHSHSRLSTSATSTSQKEVSVLHFDLERIMHMTFAALVQVGHLMRLVGLGVVMR